MRYPIVAIAGEAGAGKGTLAQHIIEKYEYTEFGFAWPLKRALDAMLFGNAGSGDLDGVLRPMGLWEDRAWKEGNLLGLTKKRPEFIGGEQGWITKEEPITPRFLAQTLGTEWGRETVSGDFWLQLAEREISATKSALLGLYQGAVFTDLRFPNETKWVKQQGGIVVFIERPDNPHRIGDAHESERHLNTLEWDIRLSNVGTVQELHDKFEEGLTLLSVGNLYQKVVV